MHKLFCIFLLILCAQILTAADDDEPKIRKDSFIEVPVSLEIVAEREDVWKKLTSVEGFTILTGMKPDMGDREKSLKKLGDHFGAQIGSDTGHVIVTYYVPDKELRVVFEPAHGSYLSMSRIMIRGGEESEDKDEEPTTVVEYWERNTDGERHKDDQVSETSTRMKQNLEKFRALVEKD